MSSAFIKDEQIRDLVHRLKFTKVPVEIHLDKIKDPPAPDYSGARKAHSYNGVGEALGMAGYEVGAHLESAMRQMPENELLMAKFREFILVAKLTSDDKAAAELQAGRQRELAYQKELVARDRKYQSDLLETEQRRCRLQKNWDLTRASVFDKWRKIVNSLAALIRKYPDLNSAAKTDVILLRYLQRQGKVEISDDNVATWIDVDGCLDMSFDDIMAAIDHVDLEAIRIS